MFVLPASAASVRRVKKTRGSSGRLSGMDELRSIATSHTRVMQLHNFATEGHYALQVDFEAVERPQIELDASIKPDWHTYGTLGLDVANPSTEPLGFSVEVEDAGGAKTVGRTALDLEPHETGSYALALNPPASDRDGNARRAAGSTFHDAGGGPSSG